VGDYAASPCLAVKLKKSTRLFAVSLIARLVRPTAVSRLKDDAEPYHRRINCVIDHIRDNLVQPLDLKCLSALACFSDHHFHRFFGAVTGETLKAFTNRARLEKAARLLSKTHHSLTEIALQSGFSSPATFSRAFQAAFATTPSRFRNTQDLSNSKICKDLIALYDYYLPMSQLEKQQAFPVTIQRIPAQHTVYLRVANAFKSGVVHAAFARVLAWAKDAGVYDQGRLFGMSFDDPAVTPKHLYRYDVCFATDAPIAKRLYPADFSSNTLATCSYAVTRVQGDIKRLATAWDYLVRDWLINSAFEPAHAPAMELYQNKYLALDWSQFDLKIAFPIQKMRRFGKLSKSDSKRQLGD
jgi:AraC family transcriptional regulator